MDSVAAVIDALERAPRLIVPLVREVPPAVLKRRPAPAKWSAHEHASVFIMFRHVALHDFLHAYRIEEALLRKEWERGLEMPQ